ncbi:MAG TPA: hypothetical protein VEC19_09560 [Usitatibacter sp.]|nr:hypothetical protein [Usitatibacter sp.]
MDATNPEDEAMKAMVRELEARLIRASSAVECLAVLIELAEAHADAHRNREGLRCAREALNIARVRNDPVATGRALAAVGRCQFQKGDYAAAVAAGLGAVDGFDGRDLPRRSRALQDVARALVAVESYDLAEEIAERAAVDALRGGDAATEARARTLWGSVLAQRDRFGAARRQFREAGAIQRRLGDTTLLKRSASSIAEGYRIQGNESLRAGNLAQARLQWRQAIRVYRVAIGTGTCAADDAMAHAAIAECECRLERPEQALAEVRRGLEHALLSRSPLVLARCHLWESHALKALGRLEDARAAIERARDAAEQLDHAAILAECLKAESMLNDLAGRFESAQDLEQRAERVAMEREAFFARVRDEVAMLWSRHVEPRDPVSLRVVA